MFVDGEFFVHSFFARHLGKGRGEVFPADIFRSNVKLHAVALHWIIENRAGVFSVVVQIDEGTLGVPKWDSEYPTICSPDVRVVRNLIFVFSASCGLVAVAPYSP